MYAPLLPRPHTPRYIMPPLYLLVLLAGVPFTLSSSHSSTDIPPPADATELVRDDPLYPVLRDESALPLSDLYNDIDALVDTDHSSDASINPDVIFDAGLDPINVIDPDIYVADSNLDLVETEHATNVQSNDESRVKRSATQQWDKPYKSVGVSRRVHTGDTILNIRGAVRDAIGDAGAAPGPRASSRLDTFVIHPARPVQTHVRDRHDRHETRDTTQEVKIERELLVEAHSVARIPCELSNTSDVLWYKDGEALVLPPSPPHSASAAGAGGEGLWLDRGTLVVGRATRGDAASWRCTRADDKGNTVSGKPTRLLIYESVRAVYLAVDGRRLDAGNTWVPVRDKTELEVRCVAEGGVPAPELLWRLSALEPALDHRPYLRVHRTNYSIDGVSVSQAVVTAARELHNATLSCDSRQRTPRHVAATAFGTTAAPETATATTISNVVPSEATTTPNIAAREPTLHIITAKLEIHVTYPPSFVISRWPGFGISLSAGVAAALRCDVDANPPARAWWLRDDANPTSSPPPLEAGDEVTRGSATLRWAALRSSHAGWYRCRATWLDTEYSSIGYYLNVIPAPDENIETATEAETEPEIPDHQKVEVPLGGNVQLHCPKGSVGCWWRRIVGNSSDTWAPAGSHHAHGVLGIKDALYQEGGEYRCVGARAPDLMRLRELKRVTLKVTGVGTARAVGVRWWGGAWTLECVACGRDVRVVWAWADTHTRATLSHTQHAHCYRTTLRITQHDEVWCVAATSSGGAVAVFPRREPPPPATPPAPARHSVRSPHSGAPTHLASTSTLTLVVRLGFIYVLKHFQY